MIKKIYLHWTAGRYDQLFCDYHICIDGEGGVHRMGDFSEKKAHTWLRNTDAVGIAICCCYGASITSVAPTMGELAAARRTEGVRYKVTWGDYPPTEIQIASMAKCVAEICKEYNLPIDKNTVMTHAEVADIDGYGVHDNDPDLRCDLLRLPGYDGENGGEVIRRMAHVLARPCGESCPQG